MVNKNHAMKVSPASMTVDLAVTLYPLSSFDITMRFLGVCQLLSNQFSRKTAKLVPSFASILRNQAQMGCFTHEVCGDPREIRYASRIVFKRRV